MRIKLLFLLAHLANLSRAFPELASIVSRFPTQEGALSQWLEKRAAAAGEDDNSTGYRRISTSGANAWKAPGPGDKRGPCPALNAMANHGYFPRNGIVGLLTVPTACNQVFGERPTRPRARPR